jgi:hypothetical protein
MNKNEFLSKTNYNILFNVIHDDIQKRLNFDINKDTSFGNTLNKGMFDISKKYLNHKTVDHRNLNKKLISEIVPVFNDYIVAKQMEIYNKNFEKKHTLNTFPNSNNMIPNVSGLENNQEDPSLFSLMSENENNTTNGFEQYREQSVKDDDKMMHGYQKYKFPEPVNDLEYINNRIGKFTGGLEHNDDSILNNRRSIIDMRNDVEKEFRESDNNKKEPKDLYTTTAKFTGSGNAGNADQLEENIGSYEQELIDMMKPMNEEQPELLMDKIKPDMFQKKTYTKEYYVTIDSKDRNKTKYPNSNDYRIDFGGEISKSTFSDAPQENFVEKRFSNVVSVELVNAILPKTTILPYILLEIDELGSCFQGSNQYLSKAFAKITESSPSGNFLYYSRDINIKNFNPRIQIKSLSIKFRDPDGQAIDFSKAEPSIDDIIDMDGTNNTTVLDSVFNNTNAANQKEYYENILTFRIIAVEKSLDTTFLRES